MSYLRCLSRASVLFLAATASADGVTQHGKDGQPDDPGLSHYVSRPDLLAPKWDFKMHHPELNSPGYWFVAPYRGINGEQSDKSWVGPAIYDGATGELIWSGGLDFHTNNADFRISNVNGEPLMTLFGDNKIFVMNDNYTIRTAVAPEPQGALNTHELSFVDNGTRAIFLKNDFRRASEEDSLAVGFDGECIAKFDGFQELAVTREGWPVVAEWKSYGRIPLKESTYRFGNIEDQCKGWDYLHANAVDKLPSGDYIYSVRHTDTIYKISGEDGSILWRLGGAKSDFQSDDVVFSRQHNARYRGQNSTHMWISIMDNSRGEDPQPATNEFSRGLLIAVDETNMVASLEAHYDHPVPNSQAQRRGNYQLLPNGNVFMGWSERAMQSEYTPDGTLIWEAILSIDWMGSYRNYKFDFVGKPIEPPTAISRVDQHKDVETVAHVSWNGATEVSTWKMYRTTPNMTVKALIATESKTGFETELRFKGFAKYVVIDAIDVHGKRIGNTSLINTVASSNISAQALLQGEQWVREAEQASIRTAMKPGKVAAAFCVGAICGILLLLGFRHARPQGIGIWRGAPWRPHKYAPVSQDQENGGIMPLRQLRKDSIDPGW